MVLAGQRIMQPQGKIQKVQCHSKFKNCDWFFSVNLLQQLCITVPKTLHRYLSKYLFQLNEPLVWEESFNAFCQNPPNVLSKKKESILKPVGRLLALNLAWAWKGCCLPSLCIILHWALTNAQGQQYPIPQSFLVLKQRACTADTQQH